MTGDPVSASTAPVSALARGSGNTGIEPMATLASSSFQFDTHHPSPLTLNRFHCPHSIPDDMFQVPTVLMAGMFFFNKMPLFPIFENDLDPTASRVLDLPLGLDSWAFPGWLE